MERGLALSAAYFGQFAANLLEINYRLSLARAFWIQPDIQGIIQPKGRTDIPDVLVIGFAVGVVL